MSKRKLSTKEMVSKSKNKVLTCSTPEHRLDSPSRDSDSICDSDAGSPVPFLCTQDGIDGETDVVWNFYTPKSEHASSRSKNTTPVSRKSRKALRSKLIVKPEPKRKPVRSLHKKTELFQDLVELNQNLHELIKQKAKSNNDSKKLQSGSEDDIFSDTSESSPKSGSRTSSRCLRKNVLSSKFKKQDPENCLESDDSMNECLLRASQVVEENIIDYGHSAPKRPCFEILNSKNGTHLNPNVNMIMDQDPMDTILSNIKLESPILNRSKKCDSPRLNNDSFDNLLGNLNDSAVEWLSQMPIKDTKKNVTSTKDSSWVLENIVIHGESPSSKSIFGRHSSMPESPSMMELNKPSTSGMAFGRYSSMPFNKSSEKIIVPGDSPIRCTQDEIKKKHQQARERLMAKRLLPFTTSQQQSQGPSQHQPNTITKKCVFQPKVASTAKALCDNNKNDCVVQKTNTNKADNKNSTEQKKSDSSNVKLLIEKKRQEALMKLRRRQPQTNLQ